MVAEVLAYAGGVLDDRDAVGTQVFRRAHAGEHQDVGRADGAAAQDDFVGLGDENLAAGFQLHADGPVAVEQYPMDVAVGLDGQVQAVAGFGQVAQVGAHPDAVGVVERRGADAVGIGVIVVPGFGKAGGDAGGVERVLRRQPGLAGETVHHDGAIAAVKVVVAVVGVGFNAAKDGQQLGVAPLVVALRRPAVVILRHAAQEHLPVDGAGAAGNLAPGAP